jgi:hypothetical protein
MVTPWEEMRRFTLNFHDRRISFRGLTMHDALSEVRTGRRPGDLVIASPRVAATLRRHSRDERLLCASSFEFSRPARAALQLESDPTPECDSEVYSAAEFAAPLAFRFPGCEFLHVNSDAVHIEILDVTTDMPVAAGVPGRVIVSDLLNTAMPLLRYDLGDVAVNVGGGPCSCGRVTPRIRLLARQLSTRSSAARCLASTVAHLAGPAILIQTAPDTYVVLCDGKAEKKSIERDANRSGTEVRFVSCIPSGLTRLAEARATLSIAERPMPSVTEND